MAEIASIRPRNDFLWVVFSGVHTDIRDLPDDIERIENERERHGLNRVFVDLRDVTGKFTKTDERILYDILKMWSDTRIALVLSTSPDKLSINKPQKKLGLAIDCFKDIDEAVTWLRDE